MNLKRTPAIALVSAALVAAVATNVATAAESAAGVGVTEATDSHFPDMAFVLSLPKKQPLTAAQLGLTENRKPVQNLTVAKPGADNVGVVLVIDASNSMKGRPIAGAMAAARAFAARRTPGQQLALITFNGKTTVVLPLTNGAAAITKALAQTPDLAPDTHIYDALDSARKLLEESGVAAGSIVLLSDGKDIGSDIDQTTAISALKDTKVRVFAVGLHSGQYDPAALKAVAAQTSGNYSEASSASALKQIYAGLGYTLSNEYVVRYRSLAGPGQQTRVAVKVAGIPGTARTSYVTPSLPTASVANGETWWDRIIRSPITLIVVVFAIVAMLGYAVFRLLYRPDQALKRRIGQFVSLPEDERAKQRQAEVDLMLAPDEKSPTEGRFAYLRRLEDDMELAHIETPVRTVLLLTCIGGLALGIVVAILVGSPIGLLAALVAPFVTRAVVSRRLNTTRGVFSDQLPDNLDVLASGLRAGHSFVGALAVCVDDAAEPSKSEFQRVLADEQLGVPVDEALHVTAKRMDSRDVVQIALVARLQREAGTNAAAVLDQVADNVRARLELRRLVATLTAQGRMARWIVSLLPVGLFLIIYLLNRQYLAPLWNDPVGIAALICAAVMVIAGSLVIKRIIEIEV